MKLIPSGTFYMGCEGCGLPDALPVHRVEMSSFWMDEIPVTNAQYAVFVQKSAYKTIAERIPSAQDLPHATSEQLVPGSIVFSPPSAPTGLFNPYIWWKYIPGASWLHPAGPDSTAIDEHPVVHVAWDDADAYCRWQGKQLPTEAEYEYAARGGLDRKRYSWGDELKPGGKWLANIWQGKFPIRNSGEDGFVGTSPVRSFPTNGYGLYDMSGNVWQWSADWYRPDTYADLTKNPQATRDPQGPAESFDPLEPGIKKRVQRGGSFLCSDQYCTRYLVGSRGKGAIDSASSNAGFRCISKVHSPY